MLLSSSDDSNIHLIQDAVIAKLPDGKKVFEGEKVLNDLMAIKRTLAVKLAGEEAVDNVNLAIQVLQSVLGLEEVQGKLVTRIGLNCNYYKTRRCFVRWFKLQLL